MNPTDTITKLRKLTTANGATPEEERRAAEKIGRLLMAHAEIAVGGVRESAPAAGRGSARARTYPWDDLNSWNAAFRAEMKRRMEEEGLRAMNGNPPEGWDAWVRARARTYD